MSTFRAFCPSPFSHFPDFSLVFVRTVDLLLDKLPQMFSSGGSAASALGPALEAAFRVLKPIGGKIVVLTSTLPTLGRGNLKPREDRKVSPC